MQHPGKTIPTLGRILLVLLAGLVLSSQSRAGDLKIKPVSEAFVKSALKKPAPENVRDLLAIEQRLQKILPKISAATVNIRVGRAQGSGVIVDKEGHIITAAHVIQGKNLNAVITLADGRHLKGKTLGLNRNMDAGMVQIIGVGDWPTAPLGKMSDISTGDWCIALGHPGGYQKGRPPVVRLGRVIRKLDMIIQTDCTLVGGDSGGPLFDMSGHVIGINSRIGRQTAINIHIPVSAYREMSWERLVSAEVWGGRRNLPVSKGVIGIKGTDHRKGCEVLEVTAGLPADKAGIQVGDVIVKLDGKPVRGIDPLIRLVATKDPGEKVRVVLLRDGKEIVKNITLVARPEEQSPE